MNSLKKIKMILNKIKIKKNDILIKIKYIYIQGIYRDIINVEIKNIYIYTVLLLNFL